MSQVENEALENPALQAHKGCSVETDHDREVPDIDLLSPLKIRGIDFANRIAMSPMCQYCASEGLANDWHLVHLGSRAVGGAALVMVEATAVTKDGRISPGDMGIWHDKHIEPLKRIAAFIHSQGSFAGIQLAHAGRKASCDVAWEGGALLRPGSQEGWQVVAPSAVPFFEGDPAPLELTSQDIDDIVEAFEAAARRAITAGFKVIEIHAAHGYLLHEFLSPISNRRKDNYGGTLENRMRLLLRIATNVRKLLGDALPLFVRISATDWVEGGWDLQQSIALAQELKAIGVDVIDVSTGGMVPKAQIPVARGYQVPFAKAIREQVKIKTAAVGLITEVQHANDIISNGDADIVFLGRALLREPYWALKAKLELGCEPGWPTQYGYALKRRAK